MLRILKWLGILASYVVVAFVFATCMDARALLENARLRIANEKILDAGLKEQQRSIALSRALRECQNR